MTDRGMHQSEMTRRVLVDRAARGGLGLMVGSVFLAGCGGDGASEGSNATGGGGGPVNLAGYGGSTAEKTQAAYFEPFTAATGIRVEPAENAALALAKLEVESGDPQFDIVMLTGSELQIAAREGLLEEIEYTVDMSALLPDMAQPYGFQYDIFAWGMAWSNPGLGSAPPPASWAQYWDTARYDGNRSLHENLTDGSPLEAALLADGVGVGDVYPLDVERAIESLDRLGKQNIIWYSTNAEPIQQLTSGAVALSTAFNGRIFQANADEGADLGFEFGGSVVSGIYLTVLKGAKNAEAAFQLINFMASEPEANAEFMRATHYGTANRAAYDLVPESLRRELPGSPEHEGQVVAKNHEWWAENLEETEQRFRVWQRS